MADPIDAVPTLAGFEAWVVPALGLTTAIIPANDPGYAMAYQIATNIVPANPMGALPDIFTLTTYNLAASYLLQLQQDQSGQTFFANARTQYGMNSFVAGVINGAHDETTGQTMTVGKGMANLDLLSLQNMTNPWGRAAMSYMMAAGTMWGLT